jgi:acetoacetyl-CoA synthetase
MSSPDPVPLWTPDQATRAAARVTAFVTWLHRERGLELPEYGDLWAWSVADPAGFWDALREFFGVRLSTPARAVLGERAMPGAEWFPGAQLNYAGYLLDVERTGPALASVHEDGSSQEWSGARLRREVAAFAAHLREQGVQAGDRVVGYLPNVPEAVVAFLATASLGAVWAVCGPEFGTASAVARFAQLEPVVLVATTGYRYGGRHHDRTDAVETMRAAIPSLRETVLVGAGVDSDADLDAGVPDATTWEHATATDAELSVTPVDFDHPLWVLFSSGTTGTPKGIVHGHGGILLEHLKFVGLQLDVRPEDRFFWYTSTSWMMWNVIVSALLTGATTVLYDGNPTHPDQEQLWRIVADQRVTVFGTSAAYLHGCLKADLSPARDHDLGALRALHSTGSPLSADGFRWAHERVGAAVPLFSASGGTDVASGFVGGNPLLPVWVGELSGPYLGVDVQAWSDDGRPLVGQVGELVVTAPMPSMPLYFWGDADQARYRASYFDTFPGVWRHGDWIELTPRGSAVIHGRSDSTLNRMGVRMGTAEIYRAVEALPEVAEALAIGVEARDGGYWLPLFVTLRPGQALDDSLRGRITAAIRRDASPRHVPDDVIAVPGIPHTITGKKLEVPVKRLLLGLAAGVDRDAVDNPDLLDLYATFRRGGSHGTPQQQ